MTPFLTNLQQMSNDNLLESPFACNAAHPTPTRLEVATASTLPIYLGGGINAYCRDGCIEIVNEKTGEHLSLSPASHYRLHKYATLLHNAGLYG